MKIEACRSMLADILSGAVVNPAPGPFGQSASAILVMARAYESDGWRFYCCGDPVNALASFWYGFGWFHFGTCSGLISTKKEPGCPFREPLEGLAPVYESALNEKTTRYARLLHTARSAVTPAPEPGTAAHGFAERVLLIAGVYAAIGDLRHHCEAREDALASFSYGHGWLDAGVTCGLFRITAHHELFTV